METLRQKVSRWAELIGFILLMGLIFGMCAFTRMAEDLAIG